MMNSTIPLGLAGAFVALAIGGVHLMGQTANASTQRSAVMEAWGRVVAEDAGVRGADVTPTELAAVIRGATHQLEGQPAEVDLMRAAGDIERLQTARLAKETAARKERALAEAKKFLAQLSRDPRITFDRSGLGFQVLNPGHGQRAQEEQTITVRYTGTLADGTEFTRMDAHEVVLVAPRVAPGLFEGVQHIAAGGKLRIFVPPRLLEGWEAKLGVPPGAVAIFDVELLQVRDTPPAELANALLPPAPDPPPRPPSGYGHEQLLTAWGWTIARQAHAVGFALSADDIAAFDRGLRSAIVAGNAASPEQRRAVRRFVAAERAHVTAALKRNQLERAETFFTALKKNPAVVAQPDGLRYEILAPGQGPVPRAHDIVVVDYVGRLLDGTVFDRTDNEPLHVEVGSVIEGWNEGIQKIAAGGRIRLYIPASLGYGGEDTSGVLTRIPAYSTLIYEISLLRVEPAATAAASP